MLPDFDTSLGATYVPVVEFAGKDNGKYLLQEGMLR